MRCAAASSARCASLPPAPAPRAPAQARGAATQFGVFWDYMSLPQGADRSEAENARYKQGLDAMAGCGAARPAAVHRASAHHVRPASAAFTCIRTLTC